MKCLRLLSQRCTSLTKAFFDLFDYNCLHKIESKIREKLKSRLINCLYYSLISICLLCLRKCVEKSFEEKDASSERYYK